jgi:hypothetical protein
MFVCIVCFTVGLLLWIYYIEMYSPSAEVLRKYGLTANDFKRERKILSIVMTFFNALINGIIYFIGTAICDHVILLAEIKEKNEKL